MYKWGLALFLYFCTGICTAEELQLPKIDNRPQKADFTYMCRYRSQEDLPAAEQIIGPWKEGELDFRSCDLSRFDLSGYSFNLADYANFDSKTRWPNKVPKRFQPKKILKQGRNPGLSVRSLHRRGIDGRGVALAIIDQPLLTQHAEYAHRLKLYEQGDEAGESSMHGAAVASIAVGKTVGVAPNADLYYISARAGERSRGVWDVRPEAEALHRLLEINKMLPQNEKIRVVSLSLGGLRTADKGAEEWARELEEARRQGVAVFTTGDIFTLSRSCAECDADDNASYTRGAYWWQEGDYPFYAEMDEVLVPTDYRVTASPTGVNDYVSYPFGGLSWGVPYAAGVYALAWQVYPNLTPELFWHTARETAQSVRVKSPAGKEYSAGRLIQPARLIARLQELNEKRSPDR